MAYANHVDGKMLYGNVDISFDPNTGGDDFDIEDAEASSRRKATVDLVWRNLGFTVPKVIIKKRKSEAASEPVPDIEEPKIPSANNDQQKVILQGVSGFVRPGTMLAVMGSSGAGKTSLLNLLAGRINSSKGATASGEVLVNGESRKYQKFKKLAAYVLQDDDMFAELTVEEQITYAALLRLPADMPREKKMIRVSRVVQELGLSKVRNTMVGNELIRGISGGERKRVNIGTELVTDPSLLFLDEPTTGLDAFNAFNVMQTLRHLASNGRTIVTTIHQPRSSIFAMFDQLCLLSEGRVMYFGPAKDAIPYFSSLEFNSPSNFNPADFFLDLLSVDPRSTEREASTKARVKYLGDKYDEQETAVKPFTQALDFLTGGSSEMDRADQNENIEFRDSDFQTSWLNEFSVLCNRSVKLAIRERAANFSRFGQNIFFAVLLGLIWLNKGRDDGDLDSQISLVGILFFIVINQAFGGVFAVIFGFPLERSVITRERGANTFRTSSYFLSKTFSDMPKTLFFNGLFGVIVYWIVGFRADAGAFFLFILTVFLTSLVAESLSLSVSIMAGDAQAAAAIIPVFVIIALLFGGFFISDAQMPVWIGWLKYTSFMFYAFNAIVKVEWQGTIWEDDIFKNTNDMSISTNLLILFGLFLFYRILGYLFLHFLRGPKFLKF